MVAKSYYSWFLNEIHTGVIVELNLLADIRFLDIVERNWLENIVCFYKYKLESLFRKYSIWHIIDLIRTELQNFIAQNWFFYIEPES